MEMFGSRGGMRGTLGVVGAGTGGGPGGTGVGNVMFIRGIEAVGRVVLGEPSGRLPLGGRYGGASGNDVGTGGNIGGAMGGSDKPRTERMDPKTSVIEACKSLTAL